VHGLLSHPAVCVAKSRNLNIGGCKEVRASRSEACKQEGGRTQMVFALCERGEGVGARGGVPEQIYIDHVSGRVESRGKHENTREPEERTTVFDVSVCGVHSCM
jgi:hypothetical protein